MNVVESLLRSSYQVLHRPGVRRWVQKVPLVRRIYTGWVRQHPIDRHYGTDTSGYMSVEEIHARMAAKLDITPYAGSQPSIARRALSSLPQVAGYTFVDLGCGKGRPMIVASEFPFADIVGVEISPELVKVAESNSAVVRTKYPERTPIRVVEGNAFHFMPDSSRIVFFLYNSFPKDGVIELVRGIERRITDGNTQLFVVSYNPVWASVLDESTSLVRYSADCYPYDVSELGYGPDLSDTVIIWQSAPAVFPAHPGAERGVRVVNDGWRAELIES